MPTKEQIETTMKIHFNSWNNEEKEKWMDNWTDDVVMFDPVGGPDKNGKIALEETWRNSFKDGHHWKIEPVFMHPFLKFATYKVCNHSRMYALRFPI